MADTKTITSLPESTSPGATDLLLLIVAGVANKLQVGNLVNGLPVATEVDKGLMSAEDKAILDTIATQVSNLVAPSPVTIASAGAIAVPAGRYFVIITGTTDITTITGLTVGVPYYFYYPSGAGLNILGAPVQAGDPPLIIVNTP